MFNCILSKIQYRGEDKTVATRINKIARREGKLAGESEAIVIYFEAEHERGHPVTNYRISLDPKATQAFLDKLGAVVAGKP
jgi:hypothetical protein